MCVLFYLLTDHNDIYWTSLPNFNYSIVKATHVHVYTYVNVARASTLQAITGKSIVGLYMQRSRCIIHVYVQCTCKLAS